jgi:hypothetical protein
MATIVECIAEDGSVVYVNLNNVNAFVGIRVAPFPLCGWR